MDQESKNLKGDLFPIVENTNNVIIHYMTLIQKFQGEWCHLVI